MKAFPLSMIALLSCISLSSQRNEGAKYSELLKKSIFVRNFIKHEPLAYAGFHSAIIKAYLIIDRDTLQTPGLSSGEMEIYRNLSKAANSLDTTLWQENELSSSVIVSQKGVIKEKYALSKFKPATRKDRQFYKKTVRQFNNGGDAKRWLYTISRPLIDNSGNYAIIADTAVGGRFGCSFYKWDGQNWKEMLNISTRD
jgi:hypothetical protein